MRLSQHAEVRMEQRAIPPLIVDWLIDYGSTSYDKHGAKKRIFDKRSRKRLTSAVGKSVVGQLSKQLSAYIVVSDEKVITVGYRTKRIKR
jgi:hypothetical protein